MLPPQGLPADEVSLGLGKGGGAVGQRQHGEDGDGIPLGIVAEFVSVERESGFQPEGVSGPQPDWHDAVRPAQLQEALPQGEGAGGRWEDLERHRLAGVTGPGDDDLGTGDPHDGHGVAEGFRQPARVAALGQQLQEDAPRLGPLQGDHGDLFTAVRQVHRGVASPVLLQPIPVAAPVGGIDDEHVVVSARAVEIGIVDSTTPVVGDHRVLSQAGICQLEGVVGQDALQEGNCPRARDHETAHVADVEQAGVSPCRQMLLENAAVLDRHLETAELLHAGARVNVPVVQDCLARVRGRRHVDWLH